MRENISLSGRLIARAFQRYWRLTRGQCLGVEACVIDDKGRALMARDNAASSWGLPKGTVQKGETVERALRRVLRDTAGIEVNAKPELSSFYAEGEDRQTALYLVRHWQRRSAPASPQIDFFELASLPAGAAPKLAERIRRSAEGRTISEV